MAESTPTANAIVKAARLSSGEVEPLFIDVLTLVRKLEEVASSIEVRRSASLGVSDSGV